MSNFIDCVLAYHSLYLLPVLSVKYIILKPISFFFFRCWESKCALFAVWDKEITIMEVEPETEYGIRLYLFEILYVFFSLINDFEK